MTLRHLRSTVLRAGLLVVLLLAGALVAFCALVVHRQAWFVAGTTLPWGLLLSLVTGYACARAAGVLGGATGLLGFGAGWVAVLLATYAGRPEGDYLVAADLRGYVYMAGGIVVVGVAVARELTTPARDRGHPPPRLDQ